MPKRLEKIVFGKRKSKIKNYAKQAIIYLQTPFHSRIRVVVNDGLTKDSVGIDHIFFLVLTLN